METGLIILLVVVFLLVLLNKKKPNLKINGDLPYKQKFILTKNEYLFYNELKKITDNQGLIICPKVGLKDLFEITTKDNYMSWFGRIAQKHIDFIICDNKLRPIYGIELDDNSHKTREDSDNFKDKLFEKSSIKLIRIKARRNTEYNKEYIEKLFEFKTEEPAAEECNSI